jgi:electron transfer flavoprotein beta subunit
VIALVLLEPPEGSRASLAALDLAGGLHEDAQLWVLSAGGEAARGALGTVRHRPYITRVIHLDDPALGDADFLTLGSVLAEAAHRLQVQLILAGERSDDEGQGLVPASVAHHLRAPLLARARALRLLAPGKLEVTLRSGGTLCTVESELPSVVTTPPRPRVQDGPPASQPARSCVIERLTLADLGLEQSLVVPRPALLGSLEASDIEPSRPHTVEDAARIILGRG